MSVNPGNQGKWESWHSGVRSWAELNPVNVIKGRKRGKDSSGVHPLCVSTLSWLKVLSANTQHVLSPDYVLDTIPRDTWDFVVTKTDKNP